MSPEELDRKLQFLVEHAARSQARFDADMQRLTVKTDRIADTVAQITRMLGTTVEIMGQLPASHELSERQLRETWEQLRETDRQLRRSDERLNAFPGAFERHLRDEHGHRPS